MNNFKVGDKVRVNKDCIYNSLINRAGIVCGFHRNGMSILIYFKGWTAGHSGSLGVESDVSSFFRRADITNFEKSCYFIDKFSISPLSNQLEFNFEE